MDFILKFLQQTVWPFIVRQWIGFLIAVGLCTSIFCWFYWPMIEKYNDLGTDLGTYRVAIGESKTVSTDELTIHFDERLERIESSRTGKDTVRLFPMFAISPMPGHRANYYKRFTVGRRLGHHAQYYDYVIELVDIEISEEDTVATWNVYRKVYPENMRPGK